MEQVDDGLNDSGNWPSRKRLRTSHACDGCRTRKTRCDGGHPCATCASANQECAYGSEANSRSKTDVILESVLRVERSLHELKSNISSISPQITSQPQSQASPQDRRTNSFCGSTPDASLRRRSFAIHTPTSQDLRENGNNFENAVLDSMHTSTTDQSVAGLRFATGSEDGEKEKRLRKRKMGDVYFQLALKKIHVAHLQVDSETTQCLFFAAIYFASLVRPLQAWEYLSATATRCMLLLSYPSDKPDVENEERIRRIFWSCYILESDYMAELSACPPSGIARVESSVQLPSVYHTHTTDKEEEESSLYFLACISMRRLLNRVHQLLYARDSGAAFDQSRFPRIVAELQRQLDDWRDVLPASFYFSIDTEETTTEAGGFLRQRYLTCRGVIYRPYLMWMLSDSHVGVNDSGLAIPEALTNSKACLDACLLHALNLRGFSQTVMIDTWICSLSMSGAMLILLAACQVPTLKELISHRVTRVGDHLQQLFHHWRSISFGADSPSVERSLGLIEKADEYIKESC
ncbi:hypothetical protein CEP52_008489 [Fusarium oligoseptatum]|uniref:Zn(2)-C6 fungal-type domain-containing protein n=1 Tax=Fusarium oligoseptatum TaxID=2604345 RepID=A0A428THP5_9HYPO|nr:hypothetical protein CEP52_008489 [Fusarium oligoseptatum]